MDPQELAHKRRCNLTLEQKLDILVALFCYFSDNFIRENKQHKMFLYKVF